MGRYAGEEYSGPGKLCNGDAHNFAPNGRCWTCDHTLDSLIDKALGLLRTYRPGALKKKAGGR